MGEPTLEGFGKFPYAKFMPILRLSDSADSTVSKISNQRTEMCLQNVFTVDSKVSPAETGFSETSFECNAMASSVTPINQRQLSVVDNSNRSSCPPPIYVQCHYAHYASTKRQTGCPHHDAAGITRDTKAYIIGRLGEENNKPRHGTIRL